MRPPPTSVFTFPIPLRPYRITMLPCSITPLKSTCVCLCVRMVLWWRQRPPRRKEETIMDHGNMVYPVLTVSRPVATTPVAGLVDGRRKLCINSCAFTIREEKLRKTLIIPFQ